MSKNSQSIYVTHDQDQKDHRQKQTLTRASYYYRRAVSRRPLSTHSRVSEDRKKPIVYTLLCSHIFEEESP